MTLNQAVFPLATSSHLTTEVADSTIQQLTMEDPACSALVPGCADQESIVLGALLLWILTLVCLFG